jgi:hypothetical protein
MYPNLTCPNCRASHDLEADIEETESDWEAEDPDLQQAIEASKQDSNIAPNPGQANNSTPARPRVSLDHEGDSPMPDAVSDSVLLSRTASMAAPARPAPTAPPPDAGPNLSTINYLDGIVSSEPAVIAPSPTPPRNIPPRMQNQRHDLAGVNGIVVDGPMTPRNDVGPFVLDGSAGRSVAATAAGTTTAPASGNRPRSASHLSLTHEGSDI